MLSGFANENMGQNRFMARTRQLNSSFSNAIGTKEVTPLPDIYRNMRKAPINQVYANAINVKPTSSFNPVGFVPQKCGSGRSCGKGTYCLINSTNVATGETADWCVPFAVWQSAGKLRFDGGFANAIGKTTYVKPSPTPPLALAGCNPSSSYTCMNCAPSGGSPSWCPSGVSSIYGPAIDQAISECGCTAISTRPTSRPTNVSVKFDGGFANAYGNPVQRALRPLVYNPYKNASGDCGCGCNGDALLGL